VIVEPMRLSELAERLGGRPVEGDAAFLVRGVASLEEGGPEDLGFVRSARFAEALAGARIGALIAPPGVDVGGRPVIRTGAPSLDFARAAGLLVPRPQPPPGRHASAVVSPDAEIHPSAFVGPLVVVGARTHVGPGTVLHAGVTLGEDVSVGADCTLHSGVVVRESVTIGSRVILQPGAVIGGDGFGYEFNERGEHEKVPQIGTVVIEDDVEIGANATVDRARLGATRIGRGVKIDNLVQIGHNCVIGEHSVVVAQSGLAGSTVFGSRVFAMAQTGFANHARVGDGSFIGARAGVIEDFPPRSRLFGFPARPERAWLRSATLVARLPEFVRRLRAVERRLGLGRGDHRDGPGGEGES
jgi:UDP-3-O-[3-hydroxymyristoyl] glucosamine N-acyltransferase